MKKAAAVVPWFLAGLLSVALVVQYVGSSGVPEPANQTSTAAEPAPVVDAPEASAANHNAKRLQELEAENEQLREHAAMQEQEIAALGHALNQLDQVPAPSQASTQQPEPGVDRAAMTGQLAEMQLERRYGTFLAALELDPARERAIREALLRVLGYTSDDFEMTSVEFASLMRDAMREVMTPKELAQFDEYQERLPEQMLHQSFAGQVNAMAPSLSEGTRAALVDVLVEEALIASLTPTPEGASTTYPLEQRMNVYANTATRFEGVLDDRESDALGRFLELQYAQLQTTLEEIQRAEAAGAIAQVDIRDGAISVQIEQTN